MHIAQIRVSQSISAVVIVIAVGWGGRVAAQCTKDLDCKGN